MAVVILAVMPLCVANLLPQRVSDAFRKRGLSSRDVLVGAA
jgi:hypothetical protein